MDIRYFEYLQEINRCKSFKKAEKQLHISAQQLGRIVTMMEKEFDVVIFERTNFGLHLTKEGEEFLTKANAMSNLYQSMYPQKDRQERFFPVGMLTICASINTWPMMGEIVAAFVKQYPGVLLHYRMCTDLELLDNVARYDNTVGILFCAIVKGQEILEIPKTLQAEVLQKNEMAVYCGKSNPLILQYKKVSLKSIQEFPLIVYAPNEDDEIRTYKIYEFLCGKRPTVKYSTNDYHLFNQILQESEDAIYIGASYPKEVRKDYCAMIELLDDVTQEIRLIKRPEGVKSLTVGLFEKHIKQYILQSKF